MEHSRKTEERTAIALLSFVAIVWGSNWPIMKIALSELPVFNFRTWCVVGGTTGLFTIAWLRGDSLRVPRKEWGRLIAVALFNVTSWMVLGTIGLQHLPPGRAAILAYTMPAWTLLFSYWLLKEPLTRRRVVSLTLACCGLALLLIEDFKAMAGAPIGALCMLAAALCWGFGIVIFRKYPLSVSTTASVAWQLLVGGLPIIVLAFVLTPEGFKVPSAWPLAATIWNAIVVFIGAQWAWFRAIELGSPNFSAMVSVANPVIGVFATIIVMSITPSTADWCALGFIVASLLTTVLGQSKREAPSARLRG
jgi:drug/metabolite transporter (DMT)-like permease